jgi:leader peptidase (prepilin peptidase)/N-methyltransferase
VGGQEKTVGVPLIHDGSTVRSRWSRWSRWAVEVTAVASIALLALGLASGVVPLPAAVAVALLVPAAVIDVEHRRLPDTWVVAALVGLVIALAAQSAVGQMDTRPGVHGIVPGAAAMALPILVLHLVSPASMGFGDVKASMVLGAALGTIDWRLGAAALCIAALTGAAAGMIARRRTIAFGPFLVFGAWLTLLAHPVVLDVVFSGGNGR